MECNQLSARIDPGVLFTPQSVELFNTGTGMIHYSFFFVAEKVEPKHYPLHCLKLIKIGWGILATGGENLPQRTEKRTW